jgi:DHA1 family multidrug resistance protein-like MFS transporter
MIIALPETSAANILLRQAHRLRKITGKTNLQSKSEIDQAHMTPSEVAFEALIKPWQINALDLAVVSFTSHVKILLPVTDSYHYRNSRPSIQL